MINGIHVVAAAGANGVMSVASVFAAGAALVVGAADRGILTAFAVRLAWQSALLLSAGLLVVVLLRARPARAHAALALAMLSALMAPALSIGTRTAGLGLWSARNAPAASIASPVQSAASIPWPLRELQPADTAASTNLMPASALAIREPNSAIIGVDVQRTAATSLQNASRSEASADSSVNAHILPRASSRAWPTTALLGVWLVLSTIVFIRFLCAGFRARALLTNSHPVTLPKLLAALDRAANHASVRRPLLLLASPIAPCPVVWAWSRRAIIIVPQARIDSSGLDWSAVFAHELAHLSRRDHVWQLMADALCILLPWNPLAWRARRGLTMLSDEACDEHALSRGESAAGLAETLLRFAPLRRTACVPAAVGDHGPLHGRIVRILRSRRVLPFAGRTWSAGAAIVAGGLTLFLALAQARAAKPARADDPRTSDRTISEPPPPAPEVIKDDAARPSASSPPAQSPSRPQARIVSSDTIPDAGIDARESHAFGDPSRLTGLKAFEFTFDDSASVTKDGWTIVETGGDAPPTVAAIEQLGGNRIRLKLDRPITAGQWTTITFNGATPSVVRVGFLPGDVDQSGTVSTYDITALIDCLNGQTACEDFRKDIDRTGLANGNDITRLIDVLQNVNEDPHQWLNESLPPVPLKVAASRPRSDAANLLKNEGMESGRDKPDAWVQGDDVPGVTYAWDRTVGHNNSHSSLRLTKTVDAYFPIAEWYQELPCTSQHVTLDVSAYVKVEALTKAVLDVQFVDGKEQSTHKWAAYIGAQNPGGPRLTHDWREYRNEVEVPIDTRKLRVAIQIYGPGTLWLDDVAVQLTPIAPPTTNSTVDSTKPAPAGDDSSRTDALLRELERQVLTGDRANIFTTASAIAEQGDARIVPALIGLIDSDNSYWTIYGVGYFGLTKLTGVQYDDYHHGPWWRAWWEANRNNNPAAADVPIPDYPLTPSGAAFRKDPPAPDTIILNPTTEQLLARLVRQSTSGAPGSLWQTATRLGETDDPHVVPTMIGLIAADNTYDTVYGIGYFGLARITHVSYDETHDGAWWKTWWMENRLRFPAEVAAMDIPMFEVKVPPAQARRERDIAAAAAELADVPAIDLQAGGDADKRYILIGPNKNAVAPTEGYRLLLVLPGGDGSTAFGPFVKRIFSHALPPNYVVAELIAPQWTTDQQDNVVWPTASLPWKGMKFTTEEFVEAVVRDAATRVKVDPRFVFTLSWSSGGPAAYDAALRETTPITGSFVAMSVFHAQRYAHLERAKDRNFYILHSPDDQLIPMAHPQRARDMLSANGANVKLTTYEGGHGWNGEVYGTIREGVTWLELQQAPQSRTDAPAPKP